MAAARFFLAVLGAVISVSASAANISVVSSGAVFFQHRHAIAKPCPVCKAPYRNMSANLSDEEYEKEMMNWDDWSNLFDYLQNLFNCIDNLDKKYQFHGLIETASKCANDPSTCLSNIYDTYLEEPLGSLDKFMQTELSKGTHLDLLGMLDNPHWAINISNAVVDKISDLAALPGLEPFQCAFDFVIVPVWDGLGDDFKNRSISAFLGPVKKVWDALMDGEMLQNAIDKIQDIIETAMGADLMMYAKRAAVDQCQENMVTSKFKLQALIDGKKSGKTGSELVTLRTDLTQNLLADDVANLATVAATALTNFAGSWLENVTMTVVTPIIRQGNLLIQNLISAATHAIDGFCGLIPEFGAAACATITSAIQIAQSWVSENFVTAALDWIKQHLGSLINSVVQWVKENVGPATRDLVSGFLNGIHMRTDPFSRLLQAIEPAIRTLIQQVTSELSGCSSIQRQWAELLDLTVEPETEPVIPVISKPWHGSD
eukprot:gb/GFBE01029383.1/.p1 GENE.gb/GFBE01029383.1/~~gb/GFBE01029383.1/.p1  ORF type:complete len:487 (+),score=124.26 gb/GFBE01029383.1/:1-1461(+)